MNSIHLLQALLQRAEGERDNALTALRQAEALEAQAQAQARHLQDYRGEYDQRWVARFQQSGTPELLHCHRGFGQRLDQAIAVQSTNAAQLGNRVQRSREKEVWVYTRRGSQFSEINFTFNKRANQFVEDHYELSRFVEFQPIWYPAVEAWRTGEIDQ